MVVLSDIIKTAVFREEMIVSQVSFQGETLVHVITGLEK